MQTINLTPSWESILPLLLESAAKGNQDAIEELTRMAKIADAYVKMVKKIS